MKNRFDGCVFSVKPTGGEVSNSRLVELIGEQEVVAAEFRGKRCAGCEPQDGYEVGPDKLVRAYNGAQGNSSLKFEFFVRFKGKEILNPIRLVPDHELSSLAKLAKLIARMKARIDSPLIKKVPRVRGVFPMNVEVKV